MKEFFRKIGLVFADSVLRKRIFFTVGALAFFRLLSAIPSPGVNQEALAQFFASNQFIGLLNILSGGGLSQLSIVMLGVGPYVTASIIMQLMTVMIPRLKEIYTEEGDAGRMKFAQWSRMATIPLAFIQGFALLKILANQGILSSLTGFSIFTSLIVITAGSLLLMWVGELITEYGIGNGVSLLIFGGIVASLPAEISQLIYIFEPSQLPLYLAFLVISVLVIIGVVFITEAERPIPVTYAKQVRGNRVYGGSTTYLPLRLNQSGVMPIIFGIAILSFPQIIAGLFVTSTNYWVSTIAGAINAFVTNSWAYGISYFFLVFIFTYFYTAVTFDPTQMSENLQKNGAFIPGVRPGISTAEYVSKILTRITLFGALFLGLVAVLPLIVRGFTGITALTVGGTSLLIVVSVVIDLLKKVNAQASIREY